MTQIGIEGRLVLLNHSLQRPVRYNEINALQKAGHVQQSVELKNIITDSGLEAFVALFAGGFGTPSVGTGTYSPGTVLDNSGVPSSGAFCAEMRIGAKALPAAPSVTDTDLDGDVLESWRVDTTTLTVDYPVKGRVSFTAVIPPGTHDDVDITEEGLFNADGTLLARRIIDPPWTKPAGLSTQIIHLISIARI